MKAKTLYTCEYCNTDYANKADAEACEKTHKTKIKIVGKRFLSYRQDKTGLPISITVQTETGEHVIYKR